MNLPNIWQCVTTSRRTREREAATQYEHVHREGVLRDEFTRRTHALESQIAQAHAENCRLRAENRALLNSVLGIAGIPPVIVAEPQSAGTADLRFVGAQHAVPGADAWRDAAQPATAPHSHSRHSERSVAPSSRSLQRDKQPLFVSAGYLDATSKRDPSLPLVAQDDGAMVDTVEPNGATSPSTNFPPDGAASPSNIAGRSSATPLPNQTLDASIPHETNAEALQGQSSHASSSNGAPQQKQLARARVAPRPRNDAHAIAPIRRRSWHQIYRMLEFESSRRKDQES